MMDVRMLERGAVVYADLNPVMGYEQAGHRPVLVLSDTRFNQRSGTAVVMPLTSKRPKAGYPFSIEVGVVGVERVVSYVKPGQVRTISTERFGRYVGSLDSVNACLDALLHICGRPVTPAQQNDNGAE